MSCANCTNDEVYYLNDPGANPLYYCRTCLPPHLQRRANAGEFPLPKADKPSKPETVRDPVES